MKKILFAIIAAIFASIPAFSNADTGLHLTGYDAEVYYQNNNDERSFELPNLGAVLLVDWVYPRPGLRIQKVICSNVRNMCYAEETVRSAFKIDIELFQKGQERRTGKKVNFVPLNELLRSK